MTTKVSDDSDSDLFVDEDQPSSSAAPALPEPTPWKVLIADDDVDVHVVTKFALSNTSFQGRRLSFLHAYSGKEAVEILRSTPDVALILLDVIMESDDAGLRVAKRIRSELGNELVRIVLRTGQPGQALEHSIIVDYDINDFWCKADLTTRKLFTTVISSLRAYEGLRTAAQARDVLNGALTQIRNLQATFDKHALVLTLNDAGIIVQVNERFCALAGLRRDELMGRGLHAVHPAPFPAPLVTEIRESLATGGSWAGDVHAQTKDGAWHTLRTTIVSFKDGEGRIYQYVAVATLLADE